eukprot:1186033-Prorocentrum_minimum.AAC.2
MIVAAMPRVEMLLEPPPEAVGSVGFLGFSHLLIAALQRVELLLQLPLQRQLLLVQHQLQGTPNGQVTRVSVTTQPNGRRVVRASRTGGIGRPQRQPGIARTHAHTHARTHTHTHNRR